MKLINIEKKKEWLSRTENHERNYWIKKKVFQFFSQLDVCIFAEVGSHTSAQQKISETVLIITVNTESKQSTQ